MGEERDQRREREGMEEETKEIKEGRSEMGARRESVECFGLTTTRERRFESKEEEMALISRESRGMKAGE